MSRIVGVASAFPKPCSKQSDMTKTITVALALLTVAGMARAQDALVELDPAQTRVEFTLSAALHTVHGAFKMNSGIIRFDPASGKASGTVVVDTQSGDTGNRTRDRRMHKEILESQTYPEMTFTPASVQGSVARQGTSQLQVSGVLKLHGAEHEINLPVSVQIDGNQVTVATRWVVPYVQWGLKNPSNFILRVSDKVEVSVHATGKVTFPRAPGSANANP